MTPRERVITALNHREPDKVAFDLNGSLCSGIHINAYRNLLSYLGIKKEEIYIHDPMQQICWIDENVLQKLNVDIRLILPNPPFSWKLEINQDGDYKYFTDQFGITWRMPKGGFYYDLADCPLKNAKIEDLENYPWPNIKTPERIKGLKEKAKSLHEKGSLLTIERITGGFFEASFWLRGFEDFYCDLANNPDYAMALMDKLLELEMQYWDLLLSEIGDYIDVILTANDLGGQDGPMISMEMFRKYIKPRMKRLNSFIKKKKPDVFIFFHSCGSVYDLIPDLIETGIDILNPVQVNAKDMDTKRLKGEFGDVLTFWGGGIDTQEILPYGSPQQVKDEVKRRIEDLAPGGGFVFAAVHNIQPDVPPENIMAMWEALQKYGKY